MTERERTIRAWQEEQAKAFAAQYPLLASQEKAPTTGGPVPVRYGYDDAQERVIVDMKTRLEHAQIIGASGSGKSTFLEYVIKQDINNGNGVVVLDPHGGHEDSLFNKLLDFIRVHRPRLIEQGKVHILSPNTREYVVGFNPLAPLPGTDLSVIADALCSAFERVWGADFHENPNILTMLRATFIALAELGMNLTDAKLLFDPEDRHGLRARALSQMTNRYARDEIQRIHEISRDPRMRREFDVNVIGPTNRINDFVSSEAIASMLAMNREHAKSPTKTLNLQDILEKGHILLVDLQPGRSVSEQNTNLLGTILLRYLFLNAKLRSHYKPFFVYVDECHHYMTEDIPRMLAEMRKYGVSVNLAHQWLSQLGKPGEPVYDGVLKGTLTKVIFRVADQAEAEQLVYTAVPLDLEMGVEASKRPAQIGHVIGTLRGVTEGVSESDSDGETFVDSSTISRALATSYATSSGRSQTHASGIQSASAAGSAIGHTDGMAFQVDPRDPSILQQIPTSQSISSADNTSASNLTSRGTSEMDGTSVTNAESFGESVVDGEARGIAKGQNKSTTRGRTNSTSESEALIPVWEVRFNSWHSKQNVHYMAARTVLSLPTGRAILYDRGRTRYLNVPMLTRPGGKK